jgi:hypothetical protein
MLQFQTRRRVLIVSDKPGQGKSVLLRKLRWLCDFQFGVPAALVPLEEYEQRPDELTLATDIVDQLAASVPFDKFNHLASARSLREARSFERPFGVQGQVLATEAQISGGTVAGTVIQNASITLPDWDGPSEREARRQCLSAFHTELVEHSAEQPVVIIFDTLDKSPEPLRRWVFLQILKGAILDRTEQGHKLIVVVAGVGLNEMLRSIFADTFETCFEPISSLGSWGRNELEQFLQVHSCNGLSGDDVEMLLRNRVEFGRSLQFVLEMAQLLLRDSARR